MKLTLTYYGGDLPDGWAVVDDDGKQELLDTWAELLSAVPGYQQGKLRDKLETIAAASNISDLKLMGWIVKYCKEHDVGIQDGTNAAWDACVSKELDKEANLT